MLLNLWYFSDKIWGYMDWPYSIRSTEYIATQIEDWKYNFQ